MPRNQIQILILNSLYFGAILDLKLKLSGLKKKHEKEIKIQNQNGIKLDGKEEGKKYKE